MPDRAVQHDPSDCSRCESVAPEAYRRHWKHQPQVGAWHTIADGPELMSRLPRPAHFVTILAYRLSAEGSPVHYRGPLYWEGDARDPADVQKDMQRCIELLQAEFDCRSEAIRMWLSGGRSLHATIPPRVIGADQGHPLLPRIYAAMIEQLFPSSVALTLDRSIYSGGRGRMWRLPNRRRTDTGCHKVAVSIREVLHKPYIDLEPLTRRPRKGIFCPADDELAPCPGLVQLYRETVAAVDRSSTLHRSSDGPAIGRGGDVEVLLNRCAFIRHCRDDAASLSECEWYSMISNVSRCADGSAAVHRLSEPYPSYSPQETDAKIAHATTDTGPHTCVYIQGLGFQGCPAGGCGVKAPIALSYHRDSPLGRRREAEDLARRLLQKRTEGGVG